MADQVYPVSHNGVHPGQEGSWDDTQAPASRLMSQEGVYQLTQDLRKFSETLTNLKSVFCEEKDVLEQSLRVVAHERLGELLKVLKSIVNKYQELNSHGILSAAENLINYIKTFNYENEEEEVPPEIFTAINNLALAFSSSVSECLIGDINITPRPSMATSQSYDTLPNQHPPGPQRQASVPYDSVPDSVQPSVTAGDYPLATSETVADVLAQVTENLDICFERAKAWSKYANDLMTYVKKKAHIELEYAKQLTKLSQATRAILSEQSFLPFQSLYCTALDNDKEFASNLTSMQQNLILAHKFIEPLQARRQDHDRQHKALRDAWRKEKRRLEEAEVNLKKAKQQYQTRNQEYQKAKEAAIRADQQQHIAAAANDPGHTRQGSNTGSSNLTLGSVAPSSALTILPTSKVEKKKKQEDDSYMKAIQAEHYYRACVNEANARRRELEKKEEQYLKTLRELMTQCDQTTKAVTLSFFQLHYELTSPLRVQYQALLDESKNYEPGFQYAEYLKHVTPHQTTGRLDYQFEPFAIEGSAYMEANAMPTRTEMAPPDDSSPLSGRSSQVGRLSANRRQSHGHRGTGFSDTESSSSRSMDDISPSASPGDPPNRKDLYKRRPSTEGSLSSEEILDDQPKDSSETHSVPPPILDQVLTSYSPESSPAPSRPQLPKVMKIVSNALKGMKRNVKPTVFGVDFSVAAQESPDGVPLLIKKCIAEIDNRALSVKGIYRVNGVKNRVEKICALLDSPNCLRVDLTEQLPHDVSGVLKYYLRQLPEPLMLYRCYTDVLDIAKAYHEVVRETQAAENPPAAEGDDPPEEKDQSLLEQAQEERTARLNAILDKMRRLVERLPESNRNTLQYIVAHLSRVTEHSSTNMMTASNLAIIFGPTLLRPVMEHGNELQTLIELPAQSHAIEMLITHRNSIFDTYSSQAKTEEAKDRSKNRISANDLQFNGPGLAGQGEPKTSGQTPKSLPTTPLNTPSGDSPTTTDQVLLTIDDTSQSTTGTSSSAEMYLGPERESNSGDSLQTGQSNGGMIDDGRAVFPYSAGVRKSSSSRDVRSAVSSVAHQERVTHDDLSLKPSSTASQYLRPGDSPARPSSLPPPQQGSRDHLLSAEPQQKKTHRGRQLSPSSPRGMNPTSQDPPDSAAPKIDAPVAPARLKSKQKRSDKKSVILDFPLHPEGQEPSSPTRKPASPHRPRSKHVTGAAVHSTSSIEPGDSVRHDTERPRRTSMPTSPRTDRIEQQVASRTKRHSTLATLIHPTAYRAEDPKPKTLGAAVNPPRRLPQVPATKNNQTSPIRPHPASMPGRTPPFNKTHSYSFAKADVSSTKGERGVNINTDPVQKRILIEEEDEEVSFC